MVPEHSQMWKAKIDWYFGDDVHEVFTLPSEFVDMEKILAANKGETP